MAFMDPSPPYAPTPTLLQAYCHFSRFADPTLNGHGGCEGERLGRDVPWLPASRVLEALLEGSRLALPWLVPTGFCDVRFYSWPELPPGVTRECRLAVEAEPWLMQDGTMTRLCRGQLHVQKLTSSGRHTGQYAPVAEGMTWLAAHSTAVPPLWNRLPEDAQNACVSTGTEGFYRIVGLDSCWRLATAFATLSDDMYSAVLRLPDAGIAPATNNGYTSSLLVMEGLLQATGLALTYRESAAFAKGDVVASTLRQWRLNGVGFLRFEADWTPGPVRLLLRRSWADGRLTRFDAQAADARQHIFLTAHHIEFARQDATAPLAVLS